MMIYSSIRILEVEPPPIYAPKRTHRKKRIAKKWRKKYGLKVVGFNRFMGDNVLLNERENVAYCHPDVARRLRQELQDFNRALRDLRNNPTLYYMPPDPL